MVKSPYATKYTRDQQAGKKPSIDMTNRKAEQQPARKRAWQARNSK